MAEKKRKRFWGAVVFYLANALAVFLLLAFGALSASADIVLAIYLVVLTGIVSYVTARTYRK